MLVPAVVTIAGTSVDCAAVSAATALTFSVFAHCPQHGEVLPLKAITYAAVSLSLAALLVAFVLLALARTLRSNLHSTHGNLVGALFLSQLVFVVGIARTGNPVSPPPPPALPGPLLSGAGAGRVRSVMQWVLRAGSGRWGTLGLLGGSWLCA